MLAEFMRELVRQMKDQTAQGQANMPLVGMYNLEQGTRLIEARLSPIHPPELRIFQNAQSTTYFGKVHIKKVMEWIVKKVGLVSKVVEPSEIS